MAARADQRGIYREDDLLEDIQLSLVKASDAVKTMRVMALTLEGRARAKKGEAIRPKDMGARLLSDTEKDTVLALFEEANTRIDDRRAQLKILATASSREEGYKALAIMNEEEVRGGISTDARTALTRAATEIDKASAERTKKKKDQKEAREKGRTAKYPKWGKDKGWGKGKGWHDYQQHYSDYGGNSPGAQGAPRAAMGNMSASSAPRHFGCFKCGQPGHKIADCPN